MNVGNFDCYSMSCPQDMIPRRNGIVLSFAVNEACHHAYNIIANQTRL